MSNEVLDWKGLTENASPEDFIATLSQYVMPGKPERSWAIGTNAPELFITIHAAHTFTDVQLQTIFALAQEGVKKQEKQVDQREYGALLRVVSKHQRT